MTTYKITYNNKIAKSKGDDAVDAIVRYAGRKVFGNPLFFDAPVVKNIDAETRGQKWAICKVNNGSITITASL